MPDHAHEFRIRLEDFDRKQLAPAQRTLEGEPLRLAIREYFENAFRTAIGSAEIIVTAEAILLRWRSRDVPDSLTEQAIHLLATGDLARGTVLLEVAVRNEPDDEDALYNLGMALSDQGRLEEAVTHLEHLLERDPDYPRGWVALGIALARNRDLAGGLRALERAVESAPNDGFALKNLGALLAEEGERLEEAEGYLRKAAAILPDDQQVWLNLGKLHERNGAVTEADAAYLKVQGINPVNRLGEMAMEARSRIAEAGFRGKGQRPDATQYCLGALERFEGMPLAGIQKITFEIATLGMSGINPNNPAEQYTLRSLPGTFSGLHLLCIQYVGFKQLDPSVDIGFDLSKEYEEAKALHGSP
jgi:tetratricopeptide (TPR) repeat protein